MALVQHIVELEAQVQLLKQQQITDPGENFLLVHKSFANENLREALQSYQYSLACGRPVDNHRHDGMSKHVHLKLSSMLSLVMCVSLLLLAYRAPTMSVKLVAGAT